VLAVSDGVDDADAPAIRRLSCDLRGAKNGGGPRRIHKISIGVGLRRAPDPP
jgi:hypothetical protein